MLWAALVLLLIPSLVLFVLGALSAINDGIKSSALGLYPGAYGLLISGLMLWAKLDGAW